MENITIPQFAESTSPVYVYGDVLWRAKPNNDKQLQKSLDNGTSWTDIYTFTHDIQAIIVSENGNIVVPQELFPFKLHISTDNGQSFSLALTANEGQVRFFSFDVVGNTIFVCEYGQYDGRYVYRSTDGGENWSTVFTHPNPTTEEDQPNRQHMHTVYIDRYNTSHVYITSGDRAEYKGIWFSGDGGGTWTAIDLGNYQPLCILTDETYCYIFDDSTGGIFRAPKSDVIGGSPVFKRIYWSEADEDIDMSGATTFYSASMFADGTMVAGTISYGEDHGSNNKDAALIVSFDGGDKWVALKEYLRDETEERGVEYISRPDSNGNVYITEIIGDEYITRVLNVSNIEMAEKIINSQRSTLTINGTKQ
ncbi:MAG: exo-alpha-sialidase [Fibrobacteres bacterium]|nr:exo-alpha-sialidase [Fibrobacterota bacterium]